MKTIERMIDYESRALDGRDKGRLVAYMTIDQAARAGYTIRDPDKWEPRTLDTETVMEDFRTDVEFAFGKALNKRGISADCMYQVVRMWLWFFDDSRFDNVEYAQYGLPLFKAVALAYGWPNPIGDDTGGEPKYSEGAD